MAVNLVKIPYLSFILIPIVEDVDEVIEFHQSLTTIDEFHHGFNFLNQELLYLRILMGVDVLAHKGVA